MGLRMKNFDVLGNHWKIRLLRGSLRKTDIEVYRFKEGLCKKERGGVF